MVSRLAAIFSPGWARPCCSLFVGHLKNAEEAVAVPPPQSVAIQGARISTKKRRCGVYLHTF